jgi:hypothetical protein
MAYSMDVSDFAAGVNDSEIQLELRLFTPCPCDAFRGPDLINRMNALKECFESRHPTAGVKT